MKYVLKVTKEHIANGIPKDSAKCPLALALQDLQLETNSSICISASYVSISSTKDNGEWMVWRSPEAVGLFIILFDKHPEATRLLPEYKDGFQIELN